MKINGNPGVINAFCLLHDTQEGDWSELDFEMSGGGPHIVEATSHMWNNKAYNERPQLWQPIHFPYSLADEYHTYTIEWGPDHMLWTVDGIRIRYDEIVEGGINLKTYDMFTEEDTSDLQRDDIVGEDLNYLAYFQARPMRLAFDVWWCGDPGWCGADNGGAAPSAMYCSWFKYYEYAPGSGDWDTTDYRLVDWDDFDGQLRANWAAVYAVELLDGKGVCCLNYNWGGGLGEAVPYDEGDTAADQPTIYWKPAEPVVKVNRAVAQSVETGSFEYKNGVLSYSLEKAGDINFSIYNMNGKQVQTINLGNKEAGRHNLTLSKNSLSKGSYILRMKTDNSRISIEKMLVIN
jgi:hypothetical protein